MIWTEKLQDSEKAERDASSAHYASELEAGSPAQQAVADSNCPYDPPQTEIESELAAVWAEFLRAERVGRNDNFFELGGDSMLAMRIIARLRQTRAVEAQIVDLFIYPTLSSFSDRIRDLQIEQFND